MFASVKTFFEPDWRSGKAVPTRIPLTNGDVAVSAVCRLASCCVGESGGFLQAWPSELMATSRLNQHGS